MKRTRFLALLMTLCLLTGLAVAEGCAICGGDAVCDTCGGLGYVEMKTLSGEMAQVACFGGCVEGKCPDCAVACDICGSDGLCDTCGGLGYLEMKAYGSDEMLQIACTGDNCDAGKCAVCSAGAEVAAVEEVAAEAVAADVPQGSYTFVEPAVEAAVRNKLGMETGNITYEDLLSVTYLRIDSAELTCFDDFQYMPNLTELDLVECNLSDISFLSSMTQLKGLMLYGNQIEDVSPLANLTSLTFLDLSQNKIQDVSPLAGLTSLQELTLQANYISDFSPLDGLNLGDYLGTAGQLPLPYKAPIVGELGLLVMSPEEYLGIDECDKLYTDSDHYTYVYTDRGIEYNDHGTDNPVDWYKMEDYIDALVDSGYYEVLEHEKPLSGTDYWYLGYIGPGSVKRTFHIGTRVTTDAAIIIRSFYGDIEVAYSLDIMTNDIEDTQYRLNKYINVVNPWSASNSGSGGGGSNGHFETVEEEVDCPSCTFGNCSICGGSGKYERYGTIQYCNPDCSSCDGEGSFTRTKQVWVND